MYYSTGLFASCYTFPTTMRATPTLDYDTGTDYWKIYSGGSADTVNAISAVRTHGNGGGFDITDGATHYHAYYVKPSWAKSKKRIAKIEDHIFYTWKTK